jgi:putative RecB family exonuclease
MTKIFNMPLYSYSRLDCFKQCPRKYAFQYIEKPEMEKQQTIEAHLGTVCHETVQQIYKDLRLSKLMTLEEMLTFYDNRWERNKPPNLRIIRDRYTEQNYKETGRGYVKSFYELHQPFKDGNTLGIEKNVQIRLSADVVLTGFIDRLVDHGGGNYEIIDYKTNKDLPALEDLEHNWQLPLYHVGLLDILPDVKDITCTWYFLAHNKPIKLKKSQQDLDGIKASVMDLIKAIDATTAFEPKVSTLCSWCNYEILCPARKHFIETEQLPPEQFAKEDGVRLVDEYMEAENRAADGKAKFDYVKEKIYNYGLQHGVSVVRGSQNKIRIWTKSDTVKLPSKAENASANQAIVDILKRQALWEQYSQLNSWDLKKAIEENALPKDVLEALQPYVARESIWRLYPSKLKDWE